jgi:hypothetical protein
MGPVIDCPGIGGFAGSRGHARQDSFEAFASKSVSRKGSWISDVAETHGGSFKQPDAVIGRRFPASVCAGAHEANDFMTMPHKRTHGRAADSARRSEHEDAFAAQ